MGANASGIDNDHIVVVPQSPPVCAVARRFCLTKNVSLKLKKKLFSSSGDDFKIRDAENGTNYFRCAGKKFSLKNRKTILDVNGVAVLNMEHELISLRGCPLSEKYIVYQGDLSDRTLFEFKRKIYNNGISRKLKLSGYVRDPVTNGRHYIVLIGNREDKKAVIYLGEPKQDGIPLAKIYRPLTEKSDFLGVDEYVVEIAAGVDLGLIVAMCIAHDEQIVIHHWKRNKKV